jgi:predicted ATPase/DNA-binding SARP family transcriptional activator
VEFRILGPLEVVEGERRVLVSGSRERALLAVLLIHAGEVVSAERLIDELWGSDLPANPSNALQVVVSRVRRALQTPRASAEDGERLVTRKPGYVLVVTPDELDAGRFGRLVAQAHQTSSADPSRRSSLLAEALSLWRGPALADFALADFAREEIARLEEARIRAVEMKIEAELAVGRHAELIGELKALVAGSPLRERSRGLLMLALYRSGRQGEALRVFQEGRKALVDELGVDPGPDLQELHRQILLQADALASVRSPEAVPLSNIPAQLTSFVGRRAELQDARKLLARSRLLTLTGAGGCGKTRLALEAAGALLGDFPDGVWLAELETVTDPALVSQTLAAAVGIREDASLGVGGGENTRPLTGKLIDYLRGKQLLVVLDNCEHLIEACARFAADVLRAAPRVRFLVTSRERLGVPGEVLFPVPPLSLPGPRQVSPDELARSDAVRLFMDRASGVRPAFALDADTAPAVCHICRRLDGIPLAIELAAARVRMLPAAEIAARLNDHFDLLASGNRTALPRHRTLRAAIDWSYELAAGPERELFGRLSVFTGGFTLAAAEEVCEDGDAGRAGVLDLLSRLVDQSLVVPGDGENARFRMLETLRHYAAERLTESGTAERLRRRHAEYYVRLAEHAEPLLRGPRQAVWLRRLEADHDNVSAAINWSLRQDPEVAVRLCSALAYFWLIGRHRSEVRRRLAEAVDAARGASPASRARALAWAAQLANLEGRRDQALSHAREAHELAKDVGDPWWLAMSEMILGLTLGLRADDGQASELLEVAHARFGQLGDEWGAALATMLLGYVSVFSARYERAAALARRGLEGFRVAGDQWGQTMALELLGLLARRQGAYDDAVAVYEEALGVARDLGLRDEVPFLLCDLGDLHVLLGDAETAAVLHKEAMDLAEEVGATDAVAKVLEGLARAAAATRQPRRAAVLLGAAESVRARAGTPLSRQEAIDVDRATDDAVSVLGREAFAQAAERGRRISAREAVVWADEEIRGQPR